MRDPEKARHRWIKMTQRGRRHFVWKYGVLRYGVGAGVVCGVIVFLTSGYDWWAAITPFVLLTLLGYYYAASVWRAMDGRFGDLGANRNENTA